MDYRYSFIDLFVKEVDFDKDTKVKVSSIVIPQIQRPYAQGRTDGICTYIRNTFLDEIFENLTSSEDVILDLNFIYGIIKPNNDEYKLILHPIGGYYAFLQFPLVSLAGTTNHLWREFYVNLRK